ncbi:MAG: hypothetical protein GWM90_28690 [Gemmatimonadetes bacterium]|nr:hypothetical protein [Gemmatimonadota bacterium]NIQ59016.1 hypothetical protein [Gemmatimonadota bacterium]NIU79223.1 hypothetical protein [Gammaproteobacteria bacterium]NIX47904.1 hypothetical protein [Gemmatimonadota bacterium]NIY12275.1 hypothetical protein [Gemmatimonadota bacterium]
MTEVLDFQSVPVNLGLAGDKPFAKPDEAECWRKDTVRFQSVDPFTVDFKNESPFATDPIEGAKTNGLYEAVVTVRPDAPDDDHHYPYTLTVGGHTVDPEIVVKKDPTQNGN